MKTLLHQNHIRTRAAHMRCNECTADNQRSFVDTQVWQYAHVKDYLAYVKPLLALIHAGEQSAESKQWLRKFRRALHTRINMKVVTQVPARYGRKYSAGYLDRLGGVQRFPVRRLDSDGEPYMVNPDVAYLRRFATRLASCLD